MFRVYYEHSQGLKVAIHEDHGTEPFTGPWHKAFALKQRMEKLNPAKIYTIEPFDPNEEGRE